MPVVDWLSLTAAGQREAKAKIMSNLPGQKQDNVYYWYYATLALFQLQDRDWLVWNQAMKQRLLTTQLPAYHEQAGSWDPIHSGAATAAASIRRP